jgi:hypothetical protein
MKSILTAWLLSAALLFFVACPGPRVAGTDEQTNAIAGIVRDSLGNPVPKALVEVRLTNTEPASVALRRAVLTFDDRIYLDTTDQDGRWSIQPPANESYSILIESPDHRMSLRTVDFADSLRLIDTVLSSQPWALALSCHTGVAQGAKVSLLGTHLQAESDSLGRVSFAHLPQGTYPVLMRSPDPLRFADTKWILQMGPSGEAMHWGPFHSEADLDSAVKVNATNVEFGSTATAIRLPLVYEYEVRSWWAFDDLRASGLLLQFNDLRARTGAGLVYGGSATKGMWGNALSLADGSQFGVIESMGSAFDSLASFSVEAWVKVRVLPDTGTYQLNLVGQLGFDSTLAQDLFSLAVVGSAGQNPSFAFLLSDGKSGALDTSDRVVSKQNVAIGCWAYLAATWDGAQACLYVNGELGGCRALAIKAFAPSPEVIYFGKEDFSFVIDEVRIEGVPLDQADVTYRWWRRFP